ncbi:MAG: RNA-binding transcriptional accessory protein, partial [Bacteroidetes bacterium]
MQEFAPDIAGRLNIQTKQAIAVLDLLEEGSTIPFIARYRKDRTGALDEVLIQKIQDEAKSLKEFKERKEFISKTITDQGKMTESLTAKINKATTLAELEDIYLPYKPKRKTKAQTARENGLEPLAQMIFEQKNFDLVSEASKYVNEKVKTSEEALQGSRDIIAELISEDANLRASLRKLFETKANLISKLVPAKESEGAKFKDYFEYSEQVSKVPSHRALAVLRGFVEGVLRISIEPEEELAIELMERAFLKSKNSAGEQVQKAIKDSYKRLLQPGLESEFRADLKQRSDEEAINVFAENLRQLLLSSPLGNKRVLAIDPGYRTGCKTVCLDEKGDLIFT